MKTHDDFLVEILTEELPPRSLLKLSTAFAEEMMQSLNKAAFSFTTVKYFATPRRLAVLVQGLVANQPDQVVERRGPLLSAAFDADGQPSKACLGFARSLGIEVSELQRIKTAQGEWVSFSKQVPGKSVTALLPEMVEHALSALPIAKRMRWGAGDTQFVRPVHAVLLLYGDHIIEATVLGCQTGRVTRGHRFLAPDGITIPHAAAYESLLATEGYVIADFAKRRERIIMQTNQAVAALSNDAAISFNDDLLDEVTGIVEWPHAVLGHFEERFLAVPREVLISSMEDHQRYFPIVNQQQQLLPYFITISNIDTHDMGRVVHGNERVLRARLADAQFFFEMDKKEPLLRRVARLQGIVNQAKLGSLWDKAKRLSQITAFIAKKLHLNQEDAARAGLLAKTDLTSNMVGEFPELQGLMGYYYALNDNENPDVAIALREQYLPRFALDFLPENPIGEILALADRVDALVGSFGINQVPTGDKDPYGLRRNAIGILRILIEKNLNLDLQELLLFAKDNYHLPLENAQMVSQIMNFIQERLRAWYQEQQISADVFASVASLGLTNLLDMHERILAVDAFKKLTAAENLSVANKRVSNILAKYGDDVQAKKIDPSLFEDKAEAVLATQVQAKNTVVTALNQQGKYREALLQLTELRQPIDDFFDHVMVMTEDKPRRENRLLLLNQLRALFLKVADIALLQVSS